MHPSDIKWPRELEADGTAEITNRVLWARTIRLWPGSDFFIPVLSMNDPLKKVIHLANLSGQIGWGLEAISDKLKKEQKGIDNLREDKGLPTGDRVSRLLLVSNDGSRRFYRHVEHLLLLHAPRLFGCMLDMDGNALGSLIKGRQTQIKIILAEHKGIVSEILRAIVTEQQ
jgi:hypothetical protein